ncbi:MAG: hypothetical protein KME20_23945 [Kaiparowitsia implicata GSE-PSE-MK54-09C]|nr:hypothetical protein [Kaiparowitsia implicata GSE-PSE-MK54-09C]
MSIVMGMRTRGLVAGVLLVASSLAWAGAAIAQDAQPLRTRERLRGQQTVQDAYEDAYFGLSGTYWRNRQIPNNITWLIGPFPEGNISLDGRSVHEVYVNTLRDQGTETPAIRTADLASPFDTSLFFSPGFQQASPTGIPVQFDRPMLTPAAPGVPPAAPTGPVRGLF